MTKKENQEIGFEAAYVRLEEILEKLNSGSVPLDESLKLYEEADKLIVSCGRRLTEAEQRIEMLIKKRNGELAMGDDNKPMTQPFSDNSL